MFRYYNFQWKMLQNRKEWLFEKNCDLLGMSDDFI